jgi:hypothetical protein
MVNRFEEMPFQLESGNLLKIELRCKAPPLGKSPSKLSKSGAERSFTVEFFYRVDKFDFRRPTITILSEDGSRSEKKSVDVLTLASFCENWKKSVLDEVLGKLFSTDVTFLDIKMTLMSPLGTRGPETQYRYPLKLYGTQAGTPCLGEVDQEVYHLELLYEGESTIRGMNLKGVGAGFVAKDQKNNTVISDLEKLFILPYIPDQRLVLQPVRVSKPGPGARKNTPIVKVPTSVQAQGFKKVTKKAKGSGLGFKKTY